MNIDKATIVIDNVNSLIKTGKWFDESRIQWIVKETFHHTVNVFFRAYF